jgi:parvulin-like peptidyl-prolyl isomerase
MWQVVYRLIVVPLVVLQMLTTGAAAAESVAATVNGTIITVPDYIRELERIGRLKGISVEKADETTQANLKREALENLISREILYQESVKQNITIDHAVVEREVDQAKAKFATPGQFTENLRRINITEATVREQVKRGLAMRTLIERLAGTDDAATDDELKTYYEQHRDAFTQQAQVRLSHILVTLESEWPRYNKKEASDKIAPLRSRILAGEDFAAVAFAHSDCLSKAKGGDLGWFIPGQLTPEMEKAVALLKVGELSDVVEDKFGLHIIKVTERRAAVTLPFIDVREKIRSLVRQEKNITMLQRYAKSLRDAATVVILLTGE